MTSDATLQFIVASTKKYRSKENYINGKQSKKGSTETQSSTRHSVNEGRSSIE